MGNPLKEMTDYHYQKCLEVISKLERRLRLSSKVVQRAKVILKAIFEDEKMKSYIMRKRPESVASAVVYLAAKIYDMRITQKEICNALGISEYTLRKIYKKIIEWLTPQKVVEFFT